MSQVLAEVEALADRYAPIVDVPSPAMMDQVRRNLSLRVGLLQEFGAATAEEVAQMAGSTARKRSTTVENWRRVHKVIAVRWHDQTLVPGFQFLSDGQPDPNLRQVIELLHKQGFGDWEVALWWIIPSPALAATRPVDLLLRLRSQGKEEAEEGRDALLRAASRPKDWF
ncbi:MAG: uncharacterized protein JWO62_3320 [Acidimicrobiaceae bacterium]|jgi:hypothetical protein|nr:uncharacterized protein [Acidimicrobiaceae bacterium]